jgi:hypothetical protein
MASAHEPYCDRQHTPRQRCNRALFPGDPVEGSDMPSTNGAAPYEGPAPAEEDAVDLRREAIAAGEAPEPTAYAGREWQSTVAALEEPAYLASEREHAMEAAVNRGGPMLGRAAAIGGALAVAVLLWSLRRPRKAEAPEGE